MKIVVVGAGTAGLISALILKKYLNTTVDVIYSSSEEIIGVGEGSTEHFFEFMTFVGIDHNEIIKECGATFKSGIMYEGWTEDRYLHSVTEPFASAQFGQYKYLYAQQIVNNYDFINNKNYWNNKIQLHTITNNRPVFNQYHFDTFKLNQFLIKLAKKNNIKFYDDKITNINFDKDLKIDCIIGENQTKYSYDFYIDATGFKRILINQLGANWVSFSKYLKMNSAIVFPTKEQEKYNMWTLSKAMNYGWRFEIPVQGRTGNGYIYNNEFIDECKAKEEIDREFGYDVEIAKSFSFDPGYIENPWIKNCVAVGLSGSFVEPLEATSIGTTIQQTFLLMHKIINYSEKEIKEYNINFISIMENIRDFIVLHYLTKKNNSIFWSNLKQIELPESLSKNLEKWKNKLPIKEDFNKNSNYCLFWENNFINIMHGLKLFNLNYIHNEFNFIANNVKNIANKEITDLKENQKYTKYIEHSDYIKMIINYF